MEDLEQQLMNTSDGENADVQAPPEQTPPQEPPQEDIKTELSFLKEPEPAEPNSDTPPIQDLWKKTKQFEQGLWKTPDDIYIVPQNYTELYNKSILTKNYAKNKEAIDNFANKLLEDNIGTVRKIKSGRIFNKTDEKILNNTPANESSYLSNYGYDVLPEKQIVKFNGDSSNKELARRRRTK